MRPDVKVICECEIVNDADNFYFLFLITCYYENYQFKHYSENKRCQHRAQNVNETSIKRYIVTQIYYNPPAIVDVKTYCDVTSTQLLKARKQKK